MKDRQHQLLLAIIDNFIRTAVPVGSRTIVREYKLKVSPATIRNEMAKLEEKGLIVQPYTSAGRVPTAKGYRFFVETLQTSEAEQKLAKTAFTQKLEQYQEQLDRQKIYQAVDVLSRVVENIGFATLPDNNQTIFIGLSNVLKQPEFMAHPEHASRVVEVLERNFLSLLDSLEIDDAVRVYIGEENLIEQFQSCSMLITRYQLGGREGFLGILGPMRMRYAYNTAALEQAKDFLGRKEL
jgi:transcriptional regulator of heat shock response